MCYRRTMPHVQIRNVPPKLHRRLRRRAADAGMSLSEYLRGELEKLAAVPTTDELVKRVRRRKLIRSAKSSAELLHELRERP